MQVFWLKFMCFGSGHGRVSVFILVSGKICKEVELSVLVRRYLFTGALLILSSLGAKFCSEIGVCSSRCNEPVFAASKAEPMVAAYLGARIWP